MENNQSLINNIFYNNIIIYTLFLPVYTHLYRVGCISTVSPLSYVLCSLLAYHVPLQVRSTYSNVEVKRNWVAALPALFTLRANLLAMPKSNLSPLLLYYSLHK